MRYEATIDTFSFIMNTPDVIEVWEDADNESPISLIKVKPDQIKSEKDFHLEISHWFMTKPSKF